MPGGSQYTIARVDASLMTQPDTRKPMFLVEYAAERALSACGWLILAIGLHLTLTVTSNVLWMLDVRPEIVRWIPEPVLAIPALTAATIGLLRLDQSVHHERTIMYWRWGLLIATFWACGLAERIATDLNSTRATYRPAWYVLTLVMLWLRAGALLCGLLWVVRLLGRIRATLEGDWPRRMTMQIGPMVLWASILVHGGILLLGTADGIRFLIAGRGFLAGSDLMIVFQVCVAMSLTVWPVVILIGLIINQRALTLMDRGSCLGCGFNLHGHFDAGCPECGWRRDRS